MTTVERAGGRSFYELDDDDSGETFRFIGYARNGAVMGKIAQAFSAAARAERKDVAEALQPRGCTRCGLTFGSAGSWRVHFEDQPGSACLEPGARGQLVERDGIWILPWSDAARR